MAFSPLYIGADHDVSYTGAANAMTGAYFNAGTCTYTLTDENGATVGSGTLSYEAASNGNYYGVIESTVTGTLTVDALYWLQIVFDSGTGYNDKRYVPLRAAYRTGT